MSLVEKIIAGLHKISAKNLSVLLLPAAVQLTNTVAAQTQRELDSHEHGSATINLLLLDQHLLIEFMSPAYNLFGFEHKPTGDEQQALANNAIASLKQADAMFRLSAAAGCSISSTSVEWEHDEHDDSVHTEVLANYEFQCTEPDKLSVINVQMFQAFEHLDSVDVTRVLSNRQDQLHLTREDPVIGF